MQQTFYRPLKGIHGQRNGKYFYKVEDTNRKHPYTRKSCVACGKRVMMKAKATARFCSKTCSQQGENNSLWKGKRPSFEGTKSEYVRLHDDVRAKHGLPMYCSWADPSCKGRLEWCNISGNYYDPDDFIQLCRSHHIRWDSTKENTNG